MSKKFSKSSSTKLLTTNPSQGWGFRVSDDKSKEKFRLYFFKLSVRLDSLIYHGNKATYWSSRLIGLCSKVANLSTKWLIRQRLRQYSELCLITRTLTQIGLQLPIKTIRQ